MLEGIWVFKDADHIYSLDTKSVYKLKSLKNSTEYLSPSLCTQDKINHRIISSQWRAGHHQREIYSVSLRHLG